MLELPNVTLIIVDCLDAERAVKSIEKCTAVCKFGAVKLLTSKETDSPYKVEIGQINSLDWYSDFILRHIWRFCDTPHMQIIQHDGWIINPDTWEDNWLKYDYMGPIFRFENAANNDCVGNGGFSLRTKRLMEYVAGNVGPIDKGVNGYFNEDGIICKGFKEHLSKAGFNFAPPVQAAKYVFEGNGAHFYGKPFGFHGFQSLGILEKRWA